MTESRKLSLQRLLEAVEPLGPKGPAAVARELNVSDQTINNWKSRGVPHAKAVEAQTRWGISAHWITTGEGEQWVAAAEVLRPSDAIPYNTTKVRDVPVVGKGSGGLMPERLWTDGDYPTGATGECSEIATADPHAFLIAVDGPSMIPRYNPGEFALVEPGTAPDLEDDVLVRLRSGQTMIKRLLSKRAGWRFGSYNNSEVLHYGIEDVTWVYYVAHPVPRRKIKNRC